MNKLFQWIGADKNKPGSRTGKTAERAEDALAEAAIAARSGDIKAAAKLFEESIRIYHGLGLKKEEASAHHSLAVALAAASEFTPAFEAFSASISMYRAISSKAELASVLKDSGHAYAEYSDSEHAWDQLKEGHSIYLSLGDQKGVASTLEAMGLAAVHDEELDEAASYFYQAVEIFVTLADNDRAAACMVWLSSVALKLSDFALAREHYLKSVDLYRSTHAASHLSNSLAELASATFTPDSMGQVHDLLNATMAVYSLPGFNSNELATPGSAVSSEDPTEVETNLRLEAAACIRLAPVPYSQGRRELALSLTERSIFIANELSDTVLLCQVLFQAGNISSQNEHFTAARKYYAMLCEAADSSDQVEYRAAALFATANEDYRLLDVEAAIRNCEACLELNKSRKDVGATARALVLYGSLMSEQSDPETGLKLLNEGLSLCRHSADAAGAALALWRIGTAARELDPEYARACLQECIDSEETDDWNAASALQSLAELELLQGEIAAAFECSSRALSMRIDLGDRIGIAAALELCAHVASEWGDIETAVVLLSRSELILAMLAVPRRQHAQLRYESNIQKLKSEMGVADFEKAWAEGTVLTLVDILAEVELMLEDVEPEEEEDVEVEGLEEANVY